MTVIANKKRDEASLATGACGQAFVGRRIGLAAAAAMIISTIPNGVRPSPYRRDSITPETFKTDQHDCPQPIFYKINAFQSNKLAFSSEAIP